MQAKTILLAALGAMAVSYAGLFVAALRRSRAWSGASPMPTAGQALIGFVTNFFDTLGIGSFATTTAFFKLRHTVPDETIPGTLNVGHTLPVILQAFIYIAVIAVDFKTLVLLIAAAAAGAWVGAGLVSGLSRRAVQLAMGGALLAAAVALAMRQFHMFPAGGDALALEGWRLGAGMAGHFLFGALSSLGVGFYAPSITLVSLLGMNPAAAFPIMMGSSAFLMPLASAHFLWRRAYAAGAAAGLTVGGFVGVPIAAFFVKSLPLGALRILTIAIVSYAAVRMLRSARAGEGAEVGG